jgi:hypothetical protein
MDDIQSWCNEYSFLTAFNVARTRGTASVRATNARTRGEAAPAPAPDLTADELGEVEAARTQLWFALNTVLSRNVRDSASEFNDPERPESYQDGVGLLAWLVTANAERKRASAPLSRKLFEKFVVTLHSPINEAEDEPRAQHTRFVAICQDLADAGEPVSPPHQDARFLAAIRKNYPAAHLHFMHVSEPAMRTHHRIAAGVYQYFLQFLTEQMAASKRHRVAAMRDTVAGSARSSHVDDGAFSTLPVRPGRAETGGTRARRGDGNRRSDSGRGRSADNRGRAGRREERRDRSGDRRRGDNGGGGYNHRGRGNGDDNRRRTDSGGGDDNRRRADSRGSDDCRRRDNSGGDAKRNMQCWHCREFGHNRNECPNNPERGRKPRADSHFSRSASVERDSGRCADSSAHRSKTRRDTLSDVSTGAPLIAMRTRVVDSAPASPAWPNAVEVARSPAWERNNGSTFPPLSAAATPYVLTQVGAPKPTRGHRAVVADSDDDRRSTRVNARQPHPTDSVDGDGDGVWHLVDYHRKRRHLRKRAAIRSAAVTVAPRHRQAGAPPSASTARRNRRRCDDSIPPFSVDANEDQGYYDIDLYEDDDDFDGDDGDDDNDDESVAEAMRQSMATSVSERQFEEDTATALAMSASLSDVDDVATDEERRPTGPWNRVSPWGRGPIGRDAHR